MKKQKWRKKAFRPEAKTNTYTHLLTKPVTIYGNNKSLLVFPPERESENRKKADSFSWFWRLFMACSIIRILSKLLRGGDLTVFYTFSSVCFSKFTRAEPSRCGTFFRKYRLRGLIENWKLEINVMHAHTAYTFLSINVSCCTHIRNKLLWHVYQKEFCFTCSLFLLDFIFDHAVFEFWKQLAGSQKSFWHFLEAILGKLLIMF